MGEAADSARSPGNKAAYAASVDKLQQGEKMNRARNKILLLS
jgi:hypothetical protein